MPSSNPCTWSRVIETVRVLDASSVLDVGCGQGTYGCLLRMSLDRDCWPPPPADGGKRVPSRLRIDAVEVYRPNITDFHKAVYDEVFIGDIRELAGTMSDYDVIILGDVIEHLSKEEGLTVVEALRPKARQAVIVVTPAGFMQQGAIGGNEAEVHRSGWMPRDFGQFRDALISIEGLQGPPPKIVAVLCTSSAARMKVGWLFSARRAVAWHGARLVLGVQRALPSFAVTLKAWRWIAKRVTSRRRRDTGQAE